MNDWYIDRAKNFIDENSLRDFIQVHIKCENNLIDYKNTNIFIKELMKSNIIPKKFGNPNARITNYRDHGILTMDNDLNDNCYLFIQNKLTYGEFIIDLMLKRGAKKNKIAYVNPTILISMFFHIMIKNRYEESQIYLTKEECCKYLCPCEHYFQINIKLINNIISSRNLLKANQILTNNEKINLNIWFTALSSTPFFKYEDKIHLKPNLKYLEFFDFLYENCFEFENAPLDKRSRYDFFCDNNKGIASVIPDNIIQKCCLNDTVYLLKYLFGIKNIELEFQKKYVDDQMYGIYRPFISIPRLVINKLLKAGKLDENLYSYNDFQLFLKEIEYNE